MIKFEPLHRILVVKLSSFVYMSKWLLHLLFRKPINYISTPLYMQMIKKTKTYNIILSITAWAWVPNLSNEPPEFVDCRKNYIHSTTTRSISSILHGSIGLLFVILTGNSLPESLFGLICTNYRIFLKHQAKHDIGGYLRKLYTNALYKSL